MIDIDFFKRVNDARGHAAGDVALAQVARALADCTSPGGIVGRLGGEEFLVIAPNRDQAMAQALGERMRAAVAALGNWIPNHRATQNRGDVGTPTRRCASDSEALGFTTFTPTYLAGLEKLILPTILSLLILESPPRSLFLSCSHPLILIKVPTNHPCEPCNQNSREQPAPGGRP